MHFMKKILGLLGVFLLLSNITSGQNISKYKSPICGNTITINDKMKSSLYHNVNIPRYFDGTTRKVLVQ